VIQVTFYFWFWFGLYPHFLISNHENPPTTNLRASVAGCGVLGLASRYRYNMYVFLHG
jgi:hypothetical protein